MFTIRRVNPKGDPTDLMTAEDLPDKGGQTRFNTGTLDAAVRWEVPADFAEERADVILLARDAAGQEVFQTFTLTDAAAK